MPRRTRGRRVDYKEDDSQEATSEVMEAVATTSAAPPPKAKRSRKTAKKDVDDAVYSGATQAVRAKASSRRSGKLQNLMMMPVDIFTEICGCLHPKDLRALSMTTKGLRIILMSKSSRHIWKSCLAKVTDIPNCPPDLTEPEFVRLLFTTACYDCGTQCGLYDYYYRLLYCDACFQINLLTYRELRDRLDKKGMTIGKFPHIQQVAGIQAENACLNTDSRRARYFYMPYVERALEKYEGLLNSEESEKLADLEAELKNEHQMRIKTAEELTKFKQEQNQDRRSELDQLKHKHEKIVQEKLLALGWDEKDIPKESRAWRKLVLKPTKTLTDRAWTKMLPTLTEMCELAKEERLKREKEGREQSRRVNLFERFQSLMEADLGIARDDNNAHLPGRWAFLDRPEVTSLVEDDGRVQVTDEEWAAIQPGIRLWARTRRWKILRALIDVLDGIPVPDDGVASYVPPDLDDMIASDDTMSARLALASSVFLCTDCHVNHVCWSATGFSSPGICIWTENEPTEMLKMGPVGLMEALCRDLQKDPKTTTIQEIWALTKNNNQKWRCRRCSEQKIRYFADARELFNHYATAEKWFQDASNALHAQGKSDGQFVFTHDWNGNELPVASLHDQAQQREDSASNKQYFDSSNDDMPGFGSSYHGCNACPAGLRYRSMHWSYMQIHFQTVHGRMPDREADVLDNFLLRGERPPMFL